MARGGRVLLISAYKIILINHITKPSSRAISYAHS